MKENKPRTPRELLNASAGRHVRKLDAMEATLWGPRRGEELIARTWFSGLRSFFAAHPVIYSSLAACWIAIAFLNWDGSGENPAPGNGQSAWALFRTVPASDLNALADFAGMEISPAAPEIQRPRSSRARSLENA